MELIDVGDDPLLRRFRKLWIDRQSKRFSRRCFRLRKTPVAALEIFEAWLEMERYWVVNLGADASLAEESLKSITMC